MCLLSRSGGSGRGQSGLVTLLLVLVRTAWAKSTVPMAPDEAACSATRWRGLESNLPAHRSHLATIEGYTTMYKKLDSAAVLMLSLALGCMIAAVAGSTGVVLANDKPDMPHLTGQWTFNPSQSDNANEKIRDAEQESQVSQRSSGGSYPGGGGYPGGGYPGGGGIGMGRGGIGIGGGGMGRGGMGGGGMGRGPRGAVAQGGEINGDDLDTLATDPKTLSIGQDGQQVSITDDAGRARTLYADGKKHKEEDLGGQKTTIKTHLDGNRLVSESKLGHSGKLTETYELSPDGKQLFYTCRLDSSKLAGPLTIRRVYDHLANQPH